MVDFTNTNPHSRMFGGLLIACTVVMPLGIMTFCYGSIFFQQHVDAHYIDQTQSTDHGKALRALVVGSVVCLFLLCPYYTVNIANGDGTAIPLWLNGLVTVLYYCSGLPVVIIYVVYDRTFIKQFIDGDINCHPDSTSIKEEQMNDEIIPLNSQGPAGKRDLICEESNVWEILQILFNLQGEGTYLPTRRWKVTTQRDKTSLMYNVKTIKSIPALSEDVRTTSCDIQGPRQTYFFRRLKLYSHGITRSTLL